MIFTRTITLEISDDVELEADVEYEYTPGEPRVWGKSAEDSHPGCGADVTIRKLTFTNKETGEQEWIDESEVDLEELTETILQEHDDES